MLDAPAPTTLGLPEATAPARLAPAATATSALALASAFLVAHGDGLATAAERLGGRPAFGRWCRLTGDLGRGRLTARQVERELGYLLSLLSLDHVGDPGREEGAFFAMIHPDAPEVHEMCLLAEALERLLADMRELTLRQEAARRLPVRVVQTGPGKRDREVMPHPWRSGPASRIRAAQQGREKGAAATAEPHTAPTRPAAA